MKKVSFVLAVLMLAVLFGGASVQAGDKSIAKKEGQKAMSALVVKVRIKAEFREQFMKEMLSDAIGSEKIEPGCMMFNIVSDAADPNTLYLFEVYKDANAVEAHKKMPHFVKWLETTKKWLAAPLEITPCNTIYPPANSLKKRPAPKK
jgi:(4S)-4-hydroxy-5-phosphonooxypentane-2,3-dione isomerase